MPLAKHANASFNIMPLICQSLFSSAQRSSNSIEMMTILLKSIRVLRNNL
jgi:hypothetical protein